MGHLKAVGRLLIAQGIAELGSGFLFLVAAANATEGAGAESERRLAFLFGLTVGGVVLLCAILKIMAGWRNLHARGMRFGYVALLSAFPSALTVWCAPRRPLVSST